MIRINVIQYGLGPIGQAVARSMLTKPGLRLIGGVDIDPSKAGKDLGEILGKKKLGIPVVSTIRDLPERIRPDVAVHCTSSWLEEIVPQLEELARSGMSVVSSSEELLCPAWKYPKVAARLDRLARDLGVSFLGTGVNPGFVLDTLPVILSGVCLDVKKVVAKRELDAGTRRFALQKKVGVGITPAEFRDRVKSGRMGHAGFVETVALVAKALDWKLDKITETIKPKIADRSIKTKFLSVKKGQVTGIHQICKGHQNGKVLIHADLQMYVGAKQTLDRVVIQGKPRVNCLLEGGIAGDLATVAMLINSIPLVHQAEPGLKTMVDLPVPRWMP